LIALAYAVGIIGCVALGAWAAQLIDLKDYSSSTVFRRLTLNFLVTFVLALVTEEGFFEARYGEAASGRDFLRQKPSSGPVLLSALWHLAVPIIDPDFAQYLSKVPQYVIGSTVFGVAMGLPRLRSGSIIVASLCHAPVERIGLHFLWRGRENRSAWYLRLRHLGPRARLCWACPCSARGSVVVVGQAFNRPSQ